MDLVSKAGLSSETNSGAWLLDRFVNDYNYQKTGACACMSEDEGMYVCARDKRLDKAYSIP